MKWILRIIIGAIALFVLVIGGIFTAARFHDGPMEGDLARVSAGPFTSGEQQSNSDEPDWRFLKDYFTVEFQLLDPARSRTTFVMETEGRIFIPSGYMNTMIGKLWKHWPLEAEKDGRAILRVDGKLYDRQLVRIKEGEIVVAILEELSRKYGGGAAIAMEEVTSNNLWLFELQPRK